MKHAQLESILLALESGDYNQVQGTLQLPAGHCCLGVTCKALGIDTGFNGVMSCSADSTPYESLRGLGGLLLING